MWSSEGGHWDPQAVFFSLWIWSSSECSSVSQLYHLDNFHLVPSTFRLSLLISCLLAFGLLVAACHECYKHYKWGHKLSHKSRKRLGCWVKLCGRTASYERTSAEIWGKERGRVRCKRPLCLSGWLSSPNNSLCLQSLQAKPCRARKLGTVCALDGLHSVLTRDQR